MIGPRCFVDENNCLSFRGDLTAAELEELEAVARQAFNAGLKSGYRQGREAQEAAVQT